MELGSDHDQQHSSVGPRMVVTFVTVRLNSPVPVNWPDRATICRRCVSATIIGTVSISFQDGVANDVSIAAGQRAIKYWRSPHTALQLSSNNPA